MDMCFLPRGLTVDLDAVPENFDLLIEDCFRKYTEETRKDFRYQDQLQFIDLCVEYAHFGHRIDSEETVRSMILANEQFCLDEYGYLPDREDEYMSIEFLAACHKKGMEDMKSYRSGCKDRREEKVMQLLVRIMKVVMNYDD